jgi:hypothetical protein
VRRDSQKYSKIARDYLYKIYSNGKKDGIDIKLMVTWGDCQMMEDLFELFGGDRDHLREVTGHIGHHFRYKYVMDKLDRESTKPDAIFNKYYICYNGIINRPTRCFKLKEWEL